MLNSVCVAITIVDYIMYSDCTDIIHPVKLNFSGIVNFHLNLNPENHVLNSFRASFKILFTVANLRGFLE